MWNLLQKQLNIISVKWNSRHQIPTKKKEAKLFLWFDFYNQDMKIHYIKSQIELILQLYLLEKSQTG
jgi:hypothetical protein